jgi:hypothetical protein
MHPVASSLRPLPPPIFDLQSNCVCLRQPLDISSTLNPPIPRPVPFYGTFAKKVTPETVYNRSKMSKVKGISAGQCCRYASIFIL